MTIIRQTQLSQVEIDELTPAERALVAGIVDFVQKRDAKDRRRVERRVSRRAVRALSSVRAQADQ